MARAKRVFYGWIIVACSVVLAALGVGMYTSTVSVFVKPVCEALGCSRAEFTLYRTFHMVASAICMPFYGPLIQKAGVKKVMFIGMLVVGIVTIGFSFASSVGFFYLLGTVNGIFVNGISFMSIGILVNNWFEG